jgi:hypothetical protein
MGGWLLVIAVCFSFDNNVTGDIINFVVVAAKCVAHEANDAIAMPFSRRLAVVKVQVA